jgi:hypothetical protein
MKYLKIYSAVAVVYTLVFLHAIFNFVYGLFQNAFFFSAQYFFYMIPVVVGIIGLLIFVTSGYKKSALLRTYMCYQIFGFPFLLFYYYNAFINGSTHASEFAVSLTWRFYLSVFLNFLLMAASVIGLIYIEKRRQPKINYFGHGEGRVGQFVPAKGSLRLANRIIDAIIISVTAITAISNFLRLRHGIYDGDEDMFENPMLLYAVLIPALVIYYLLLEGIFNTTAGKCATNTTIVNDTGERPNFGKILGRTFSRLIPFDAFSFLNAGARGWHDSIPNTYVVESIDQDEAADQEITLDADMNYKTT